ncbi:MAG: hypothetical protein LBF69_05055 [Prevotellaceae bacterium]|nr:hypothetical protein [Prevotellaceae bacterium]
MSDRRKQLISRLLMVIFALYYANICFFYHSHIINGVTIVHSHFHGKAHTQTDTHSSNELTLISALSVFQSLQANLPFAGMEIFILLQAIILPVYKNNVIPKTYSCISLRAPPTKRVKN